MVKLLSHHRGRLCEAGLNLYLVGSVRLPPGLLHHYLMDPRLEFRFALGLADED